MKNFFRILLAAILIFCVLTFPQKMYAHLNTDIITDEILSRREKYFYGTITLWQIDCFEGGTGSRATWLKEQSLAFEKKHNGVYIAVESLSPERAELLLKTKKPDIISFSMPIKVENTQILDVDISYLREDIKNAVFSDAIPWCFGVYCLFEGEEEKAEDKIVYSNKNGFYPLNALEDFSAEKKETEFLNFQYEAFNSYVNKKYSSLLGTQRDLYRLLNSKNKRNGNISVATYTDLIQYFASLNQNNDKKSEMIDKYVSFILSKDVQDKIGKIGLFPVNAEAEPTYENTYYTEVWQEIKQKEFNFVYQTKKH